MKRYEQEILDLIPFLESYIKGTRQRYAYLQQEQSEDLVQECLCQALTAAQKAEGIQEPQKYFVGVFKKKLQKLNRYHRVRQTKPLDEIPVEYEPQEYPVLSEIDRRVMGLPADSPRSARTAKKAQLIWEGLKHIDGKKARRVGRIAQLTGISEKTVYKFCNRIRGIYQEVLAEVS